MPLPPVNLANATLAASLGNPTMEPLFADDRTPTRNQVLDLLFPDVPAAKRGTNHALNRHFSDFVYDQYKQKVITQGEMVAINGLLTNTGCTLDEALDAHLTGKTIPYAPYVTEANDYIEGVVSSAAGLAQLKRDLVRRRASDSPSTNTWRSPSRSPRTRSPAP